MTNISYVASPSVQVVLTGGRTGTLAGDTLTVTYDSQFVTLDDTVTTVVIHYNLATGPRGEVFGSPADLAAYFEFLKEGGRLVRLPEEVDITIDTDTNTAVVDGTTYDVGSLRAAIDTNNKTNIRTLKISQGSTVLLKGINPSHVKVNGFDLTLNLRPMVDHLNERFNWSDPAADTDASVRDRFGYAFTGGFAGKPSDNNYVWDSGTAISLAAGEYTHMQFDPTVQAAVDAPYWGSPVPTGNNAHVGADVFEGIHLPDGVDSLFDYDYVWADGGVGRIDVSGAQPGDLLRVRMDYNVIPSIANSVIEAALDFSTRDIDDNVTFQFYLTANPSTFGNTSAGQTYLLRTEMTAYFASNEDVNALIRPVIKCNNICQVQPLSILAIIQK